MDRLISFTFDHPVDECDGIEHQEAEKKEDDGMEDDNEEGLRRMKMMGWKMIMKKRVRRMKMMGWKMIMRKGVRRMEINVMNARKNILGTLFLRYTKG